CGAGCGMARFRRCEATCEEMTAAVGPRRDAFQAEDTRDGARLTRTRLESLRRPGICERGAKPIWPFAEDRRGAPGYGVPGGSPPRRAAVVHRTPSDPHRTPPSGPLAAAADSAYRAQSLCRCATPLRRSRRRLLAPYNCDAIRPSPGGREKERDHGEEAVRRESVLSHDECGSGGAVCRGGDL